MEKPVIIKFDVETFKEYQELKKAVMKERNLKRNPLMNNYIILLIMQ